MSQDSNENEKNKNPENPEPAATPQPNLPPHLRELVQQTDQAVAKTKLDYEAVEDVVKQTSAKKEEQLAEVIADKTFTAEPGSAPKLPEYPVDDFQVCSPCKMTSTTKDRVGFCESCHCRFYDLNGMQMPEVSELIFKMEGTTEFKLWKRADGRFMTKDCPIGKKQKIVNLFLVSSAVVITLAAMFLLLAMPRSAPPSVLTETKSNGGPSNSTTEPSNTSETSAASKPEPRRKYRIRIRNLGSTDSE